tara:strand:+ start:130 stop:342 length:213 start_codon:yes stop_codon:yes gene_type:complete
MTDAVKTRETMVNALIDRDIAWIEEGYIHGDRELLWAVLSGEGWIPYNQLTDEQVRETYAEAFDIVRDEE